VFAERSAAAADILVRGLFRKTDPIAVNVQEIAGFSTLSLAQIGGWPYLVKGRALWRGFRQR
jgi:hypothetical protein